MANNEAEVSAELLEKVREALDDGLFRMHGITSSCDHHEEARTVLEAVLPGIRAQALRDAADAWQQGQWADAPRSRDQVQERIANAQFVTDWLRDRAAREAGGHDG